MKRWLAERRRLREMRRRHSDPVERGMFRLMVLDDHPYPTYSGTRAWCSGTPFWEDGMCRCNHTEEAPRG